MTEIPPMAVAPAALTPRSPGVPRPPAPALAIPRAATTTAAGTSAAEVPPVLVVGIFPPMAGAGPMQATRTVAALMAAGRRVVTLSLGGHGDAHLRLVFDRAHAIRALWRSLRGRRFGAVFLSLEGVRLRQPDRWARRGVLALQILFLLWLATRGKVLRLEPARPRGWAPAARGLAFLLGAVAFLRRAGTGRRVGSPVALPPAGLKRLEMLASLVPSPSGEAVAHVAAALSAVVTAAGEERAAAWADAVACAAQAAAPGGVAGTGGPCRALQAAVAPDPEWTVPGVIVPAWAVHLRAARRALTSLQPGSELAARRLMSWARPLLASDPALAGLSAGVAVAETVPVPAAATRPVPGGSTAAQLAAWWRALARSGFFEAGAGSPKARESACVDGIHSPLDRAAFEAGLMRVLDALASDEVLTGEIAMTAPARAALSPSLSPEGTTVLAVALALLAGRPIVSLDPASKAAVEAVARSVAADAPALAPLLGCDGQSDAGLDPQSRLVLLGHAEAATGLAANFAMNARVLRQSGLPVTCLGLENGLAPIGDVGDVGGAAMPEGASRPPSDPRDTHGWAPRGRRLLRSAAIVHVNADRAVELLLHPALGDVAAARAGGSGAGDMLAARIGFLLWEFGVLPEAHRLAPAMLDEIWCPTRFVAAAYEAAHRPGDAPVAVVGKALFDTPVAPGGREACGLENGPFLFLMSFDFHASVERKNPLALARAFADAFPHGAEGARDVRLAIKTTEVAPGHWGDPHGQWRALEAMAAADPRIRLLTGRWPASRLAALMACADCLVSPHRSEGFGYAPAQALLQGVPVIATDYSGTTDFVSENTAWPVPCRLKPVAPGEALFDMEGAVWAEIDHDALVATLRAVADPATASTRAVRAAAGQRLIRERYGAEAHAGRLIARLDRLGVTGPA